METSGKKILDPKARGLLKIHQQTFEKIVTLSSFSVGRSYLDEKVENSFRSLEIPEKIYLVFINFNLLLAIFCQLYQIIVDHDELMNLLTMGMYFLILLTCVHVMKIVNFNRDVILSNNQLGKKRLFLTDRYLKLLCFDHFEKATLNSRLLVNVFIGAFLSSFVGTLAVGITVAYFFDGNPFPLPLPYFLPHLKPAGVWSYSINFVHQVVAVFIGLNYNVTLASPSFSTALQGVALMDSSAELMKRVQVAREEGKFDELVALLLDVQSDFRSWYAGCCDLFEGLFFVLEKCCYVFMFTCFLILKFDPFSIAKPILGFVLFIILFMVVMINEIFRQKWEDFNFAIYDTHWYDFPCKDQKTLIILVSMSQQFIGLKSGLTDITLDWYANIFKEAYSAALVFKDMCTALEAIPTGVEDVAEIMLKQGRGEESADVIREYV